MNEAVVARNEPLLRTLAPALRELERRLRAWMSEPHPFSLSTIQRASLEGLGHDLDRQADAMKMDQPLLNIMLMGGTGVGKSTLLNALAGGTIAQSSFTRPTTRDPVVYYHRSVKPQRLDPSLHHCKLAVHDRPELENKILVDTPDLDSNDLANRDTLLRVLPIADVVLYVGSQEKYHDQLGWELFLQQRQRRAFAFVLNKWDRCLDSSASGLRPDEDLLRSLRTQGFDQPILFRTWAQHWVDHPPASNGQTAQPPVEGEQFLDLLHWLEAGISRLEIEAIKAHGISQLLKQLQDTLVAISPPDLSAVREKVQARWNELLSEEAQAVASVLINTLEPYQKEIEHHFAQQRQSKFTGAMAWYLQTFNKLRYAGSTLRDQIPLLKTTSPVEKPPSWNLEEFAQTCSNAASRQHLESRLKALTNRLLIEADSLGMPMPLMTEPTEAKLQLDWKQRYSHAMFDVITQIEKSWSQPQGVRRVLQMILVPLANTLPILSFAAMGVILIWRWTMANDYHFQWGDLLLVGVVPLMVMVVLHVFTALLYPFRWQSIRGEVERSLHERIHRELTEQYDTVPTEVSERVLTERRSIESYLHEVREVAAWLQQREQAASVMKLFGH